MCNKERKIDMIFAKKKKQKDKSSELQGVIGESEDGKQMTLTLGNNVPNVGIFGREGIGKTAMIESYLFSLMENLKPQDLRIAYISHENTYKQLLSDNPFTLTSPLNGADDLVDSRNLLKYLVGVIRSRIEILKENRVANINEYNQKMPDKKFPKLVLVVDDFRGLALEDEDLPVESSLNVVNNFEYIVKMGRSAGVHTILTYRTPRGLDRMKKIYANIGHRISLGIVEPVENQLIFPKNNVQLEKISHAGEYYTNLNGWGKLEHGHSKYMSDDQIKESNARLIKKYGTAEYVSVQVED